MPNFFKSFFSGKSETPESEKQKNDQKNFEIFKYDGLRAQRMGRPDYAVKCFIEALAIKEEFETMGYLSQLYIQMGETAKARELLEKMAGVADEKRTAHFHTTIVGLKPNGAQLTADGRVDGHILHELTGSNGFGYDPLFYVDELHCAMAELNSEQKNAISHRGRALADFMKHFNEWWQA